MTKHLHSVRGWQLRAEYALPVTREHRGTCEAQEYHHETNDYESHGGNVRGDVRLGVVISVGRVRP